MKSSSLLKLSTLGLSSEQMATVLAVLAEELAPLEARREKDRLRKRSGDSAEVPQNIQGKSVEIPRLARDGDIISNLPQEKDITPHNPPSKPSPSEPEGFAEFWEAYPKRDGTADRKGAAKAFGAALKRAPLKAILDGARAYAAHCKAKGNVGTQYVKQARSWLNGDLWAEFQPQAALAAIPVQIIREGTPEWEELKKSRPRLVARDIQTPNGIVRGEYGRAA